MLPLLSNVSVALPTPVTSFCLLCVRLCDVPSVVTDSKLPSASTSQLWLRAAIACQNPALIRNPAEPIQSGVLIAGIPVGLAALLDVAQVHARLAVTADDDCPLTEVAVTLQGGGTVRQRTQPANRAVQTTRI